MEKEFCTYNQALRLKEFGFDEPCFAAYSEDEDTSSLFIYWNDLANMSELFISQDNCEKFDYKCLAPTFSQAFRWFREKYNLHSVASFDKFIDEDNDVELDNPYFTYYYSINELWDNTKDYNKFVRGFMNVSSSRDIMSQEGAEVACLDKLIEIIESKSE